MVKSWSEVGQVGEKLVKLVNLVTLRAFWFVNSG